MPPETLRDRFPFFNAHPDLVYLDTAATAHKPKEVIEAITRFYSQDYATVHRAVYRGAALASSQYYESRLTAQRFINAASPNEILFTRGTTEGLNLVAQSLGKTHLSPGDELLVSEMEHHSNLVPWQMLAKEKGLLLRKIPFTDEGVLQWEGLITSKTKLVAVAHVSNVTGTIHPIQKMAQAAHSYGALLVVDGAQGAPHLPVDVQALDCDFYAFSGHKCYGPTGVGVLYGKEEHLQAMPPLLGGGDMIERVDFEESSYQPPPLRFEAGTPLIASVIALKPALDFLLDVGLPAISSWEHTLLQRAQARLASLPGLKILGTAPEKGAIITFTVDRVHPLDLATLLDLDQIAIRSGHLCAQPLLRRYGLETAARASFGLYNTLAEVDRFADSLERAIAELI